VYRELRSYAAVRDVRLLGDAVSFPAPNQTYAHEVSSGQSLTRTRSTRRAGRSAPGSASSFCGYLAQANLVVGSRKEECIEWQRY
jgi:hypothetical protein